MNAASKWTALTLCCLVASAADVTMRDNPQHLRPVMLNVIATGHNDQPIQDLAVSDLNVLDDTEPQKIAGLTLNQDKIPPPLVVLFDLMELSLDQLGGATRRLKLALAAMPPAIPVYLYLLTPDGSLYAVIRIAGPSSKIATDPSRSEQIGPLIDKALKKAVRARSADMKVIPIRFNAVYEALKTIDENLEHIAQKKQLLWITTGIPSSVQFASGAKDMTSTLRQLAANFNTDHTAIYALDPSLQFGSLNRDGLEILSAATGGRNLGSSDVSKAIAQAHADALDSYSLVYAPPLKENWRGKYHKVRVTCNRKGVRIIAQQVYIAEASR